MKGHKRVSVWLTDRACAQIDRLNATGMYGMTRTATAQELLLRALRDEVLKKPAPKSAPSKHSPSCATAVAIGGRCNCGYLARKLAEDMRRGTARFVR